MFPYLVWITLVLSVTSTITCLVAYRKGKDKNYLTAAGMMGIVAILCLANLLL
jgi:hypothetical protein